MKRVQITLLLLFIPLALGAVNWEIRGVTVIRKSVDSTTGIIRLHLKSPKGRPFEISLPGTINETQSNEILRLNDLFYAWEKIHVKKIEYYLSGTIIHIIVHPEKVMVEGKDIKGRFPAGIALFKSPERLTYHFRILDGDKSIPVEGSYTNEDSLLGYTNAMVQGVRNGSVRFSESGYTVHQDAGGVPVSVSGTGPDRQGGSQESRFTHWASLYIGSGALVTAAYSIGWRTLELSPSVGYLYYEDDDITRQALPLGLRLAWAPWTFGYFEPYVFFGGLYYQEIADFSSRPMAAGGVGIRVFRYYFLEGSYIYQKDGSGAAVGFGARLDMSALWR